MPRRNRLPNVLDRREFFRLLTQLGGQPEPGGRHQQKWRFPTRNGTRTVPISLYDEYPIAYYCMVLSWQLGLSRDQILAALNGEPLDLPYYPEGPSVRA